MQGDEMCIKTAGHGIPIIFVTGTDTGIGKSVLSLLLIKTLLQRGHTPFYCKLVQTGCCDAYDVESDAQFVYRHIAEWQGRDCAEAVPWCFPNPKAPLYAARDAGVRLTRTELCAQIATLHAKHECLLVEGAGGLCVPFTEDTLCVQLIKACDAHPIMAARAGLGTISHTLLSLQCLEQHGVELAGILFMADAATQVHSAEVQENMEAIARFSKYKVAGIIPHLASFDTVEDEVLQPLHHIVAQLEQRHI